MAQRLRVTFAKRGPLRWVGHLDMMRTWERTIRRADLPLSYSQGFSPHAKIALAAPLPVGLEGARELIDLWIDEDLTLDLVAKQLKNVMPPGLTISEIEEVDDSLPSMQSCLHAAHYSVEFEPDAVNFDTLDSKVSGLLELDELDWEEQRGDKVRRYDLRRTILDITCSQIGAAASLDMHLSLEQGRTGRPAQVLRALEGALPPTCITRTAIEFMPINREESPAHGKGISPQISVS